ncbi:MAG: hypothetical protein ACRCT8_13770 [Lacipirellulaceae bacterium]
MSRGLRELWGVGDAESKAKGADSEAFSSDFRRGLKRINAALRRAATKGDPESRSELLGQREKLIAAYQGVSRRADGADASAAMQSRGKVLAASQKTAGVAEESGAKAEVAWQEWEAAAQKLEELHATADRWGASADPREKGLRALLNAVQKRADQRKYRQAAAAVADAHRKTGGAEAAQIAPAQVDVAGNDTMPGSPAPPQDQAPVPGAPLEKGLHALFLSDFNRNSVKNLADVLVQYEGTATLAFAPHFSKDQDPYKNATTIVRRLALKGKALRLTVYFGFHSETTNLADHTQKLVRFLKKIVKVEGAQQPLHKHLDELTISPRLEDEHTDKSVLEGKAESSFEKEVKTIVDAFEAEKGDSELLAALQADCKLGFRRSAAGHAKKGSLESDAIDVVGKDGVARPFELTHEFHHKPGEATGYDSYATDGPFISAGDIDGNKVVDENIKAMEDAYARYKKEQKASDPDNPAAMTIEEFIQQYGLNTVDDKLPDSVEEVMLWRPAYNLWKADSKNGVIDKYTKTDRESRKDTGQGFGELEKQVAAKFLSVDLDEQKKKKPGAKPQPSNA